MEKSTFSIGQMIGIAAVILIILGVLTTALGPGSKFGNAWQYLTTGNTGNSTSQQPQAPQSPATGMSVVGGPSLSAAKINSILCGAGSPACGTGQQLYNLGQQYNINPAFALAVFHHESGFGKYGMAASTRSLGNLRCIPSAACWNGYADFSSWQDGYAAFYKLIAGPIYVGSGHTTPESIIPIYAPSGDGNSPGSYISAVESDVNAWRQV